MKPQKQIHSVTTNLLLTKKIKPILEERAVSSTDGVGKIGLRHAVARNEIPDIP